MSNRQEALVDMEGVEPGTKTPVEVWTDRFLIQGEAYAPAGIKGSAHRLSDLLNDQAKPFLALTGVRLYTAAKKKLWAGRFLAVNKASIVLVKPLHE